MRGWWYVDVRQITEVDRGSGSDWRHALHCRPSNDSVRNHAAVTCITLPMVVVLVVVGIVLVVGVHFPFGVPVGRGLVVVAFGQQKLAWRLGRKISGRDCRTCIGGRGGGGEQLSTTAMVMVGV